MEQDQPLLTHHGKAQCIIHEPIQFTLTLESRHGVNLVHHLNTTAVHSDSRSKPVSSSQRHCSSLSTRTKPGLSSSHNTTAVHSDSRSKPGSSSHNTTGASCLLLTPAVDLCTSQSSISMHGLLPHTLNLLHTHSTF